MEMRIAVGLGFVVFILVAMILLRAAKLHVR